MGLGVAMVCLPARGCCLHGTSGGGELGRRRGMRLPAERDLAAEYGVAYMTIRRAAALLRERGEIVTVHGRGTFVAAASAESDDPGDGED